MTPEEKYQKLLMIVDEVGGLARAYFETNDEMYEEKQDGSVVTAIDTGIESIIINFIRAEFPLDAIIGEEHGAHTGTSEFVWHIDPIDGTDNFLRKIPFCAISVARLGPTDTGSFAIVYNPITRQTFSSFEGKSAYADGHVCTLTSATLGPSFAVFVGPGKGETWMRPARYALQSALGMKYGKTGSGCAALELAYVSANRIDAFVTFGLKSYDYAAGIFLVHAACGSVSVFENGIWKLWEGSVRDLCAEHNRIMFVSHPDVHQSVLNFIGDPHAWAQKIS